jgi:putative phosphoribosyl transferase
MMLRRWTGACRSIERSSTAALSALAIAASTEHLAAGSAYVTAIVLPTGRQWSLAIVRETGAVSGDLESSLRIPVAGVVLDGDLVVPGGAAGVVLFAHGSGSSRHSPRNRMVAARLQVAGYGTLLMDLLTAEEDQVDSRTRQFRFDIERLASRLTGAIRLLSDRPDTRQIPIALFGASTGAAAALRAAAELPDRVQLVISRGGRPDLAGDALERVHAPTLLIVGGRDLEVLDLNNAAAARLSGPVELTVVPGATHLFEEPGALDRVVELALDALNRYMAPHQARS